MDIGMITLHQKRLTVPFQCTVKEERVEDVELCPQDSLFSESIFMLQVVNW